MPLISATSGPLFHPRYSLPLDAVSWHEARREARSTGSPPLPAASARRLRLCHLHPPPPPLPPPPLGFAMYVIASKRLCTSFRCVCTLPRALPAVGLRRVCSEAGPSSEERKIKLDRTGMPLSERRRREARQRAFLQELPTPTSVSMRPIGIVRTPYTLRHDCPRQPMMPAAPGAAEPQEALATIELYEGLGLEASVRDLGGFDFIWLCFLFHANQHWRPEVRLPPDPTPRAPTLDLREPHAAAAAAAGAEVVRPRQRVGVLSTRSPHRPNPLGMSALRLVSVDPERRTLTVAGIDCLDRTPVLDVKPYVPWADAFPHARATWPSDTEG